MEAIGGIAALILLIIIFGSGSKSAPPSFRIEPTNDPRFYEVLDPNGESVYIGRYEECERWVRNHIE